MFPEGQECDCQVAKGTDKPVHENPDEVRQSVKLAHAHTAVHHIKMVHVQGTRIRLRFACREAALGSQVVEPEPSTVAILGHTLRQ